MSDDELQPEPIEQQSDESQDGIMATLKDVGERVPSYAKLSVNLVTAGKMSATQQSQILGPLGYGPASRFTRFVPILNQISRILSMIGTIRFVLTQMDVETANAHLEAVGLSREQVERDFQNSRDLAKRAGQIGSREASKALETGSRALEGGARVAGRLTGKGIRSFRNWQARSAERANDQRDQS
ncbi:MAG: hypothetical protein WBW04_14260 [Nitrolancea sp.]